MGHDEKYEIKNDEKLCMRYGAQGRKDLSELEDQVKDSMYICINCGHATSDADRLCSPERLY